MRFHHKEEEFGADYGSTKFYIEFFIIISPFYIMN